MDFSVGQELIAAIEEDSLERAQRALQDKSASVLDSYWSDPNVKRDLDMAFMRACKACKGRGDMKFMRLLIQEGLDPMALLDEEGGLEAIDPTFTLDSTMEERAFFHGWYLSMLETDFSYCRQNWEGGKGLLDDAASAGFADVVHELLLIPGTQVNHQDADGLGALHECSAHPQITRMLLAHPGTNLNLTTMTRQTPLMSAVIHSSEVEGSKRVPHIQSITLLASHPETDVNMVDSHGYTALMHACECHNYEALEVLLAHPSLKVNLCNEAGNTALMLACDLNDEKAVRMLLSRPEIDVDIRNRTRQTALDVAYHQSKASIIEMLESRGACTRMGSGKIKTFLRGNRRCQQPLSPR